MEQIVLVDILQQARKRYLILKAVGGVKQSSNKFNTNQTGRNQTTINLPLLFMHRISFHYLLNAPVMYVCTRYMALIKGL